jgi:terminase small subunit-like protein
MPGTARSGRVKPTAIKQREGSRVRRRAREPEYKPGVPECPPELRDDLLAVAKWEHFAGLLAGAKILTTAHAAALGNLASVAAQLQRARAAHALEGFATLKVYELRTASGALLRLFEKAHPLLNEIKQLTLLETRLLESFGLTPISAPRVEALGAPPERSDFEAFVGGQGA